MLRRILKTLLALVLLFFASALTGGMWLFLLPFLLAFGWLAYLVRVIPEVSVNLGAVFFAALTLLVFGVAAHHCLRWLHRSWGANTDKGGRVWLPRWTVSFTALLVLLFAANIAVVGVVHQTGWIVSGDVLEHSWESPAFRVGRLCSEIGRRHSAAELRGELWRDPWLRRHARGFHVLTRDRADGGIVAAVFPRAPADLERHGIRLCGADLEAAFEGAELSRVLAEHGFAAGPEARIRRVGPTRVRLHAPD